jgi:predicted DCC family thiol-disulfide oxidoreductase YuxK
LANHILAYDVDCGPCTRFKRIVELLDARHRIDFLSLHKADKLGLLKGIPRPMRYTSFHLICQDGEILSGADGLVRLVAILPLGNQISKLIALTPGGEWMIKLLYKTFSRLHNSPTCGTKLI